MKYLNEILIEWNDSDNPQSGLINVKGKDLMNYPCLKRSTYDENTKKLSCKIRSILLEFIDYNANKVGLRNYLSNDFDYEYSDRAKNYFGSKSNRDYYSVKTVYLTKNNITKQYIFPESSAFGIIEEDDERWDKVYPIMENFLELLKKNKDFIIDEELSNISKIYFIYKREPLIDDEYLYILIDLNEADEYNSPGWCTARVIAEES